MKYELPNRFKSNQYGHTPYTYLIGWIDHDKYYYGVRYSKHCTPSDLMLTYFTSSKLVRNFIKQHGTPDLIQIRKTFVDAKQARIWEHKVLRRMKVVSNNRFLNQTDNISISLEASLRGSKKPRSDAFKQKCRQRPSNNKGKKASPELLARLSQAQKNLGVWYNDGEREQKFLINQQPQGFVRGRSHKMPNRRGSKHSEFTKNKMSKSQRSVKPGSVAPLDFLQMCKTMNRNQLKHHYRCRDVKMVHRWINQTFFPLYHNVV